MSIIFMQQYMSIELILTHFDIQHFGQHVALQPADERGHSRQVVNPFVVEEDPVQRDRIEVEVRIGVEDPFERLQVARVAGDRLERIRVESGGLAELRAFREFAGNPEPSATAEILELARKTSVLFWLVGTRVHLCKQLHLILFITEIKPAAQTKETFK